MKQVILDDSRDHLAGLLQAVERTVFFLDASLRKLTWPLDPKDIARRHRDVDLFESLAAINERFSKLQDILGSGMRHAAILAGEPADSFLKVLSFYVKIRVIESIETWQLYRAARNLAAHCYETDDTAIAEHFNTLKDLIPSLLADAATFVDYCRRSLGIRPKHGEFDKDLARIARSHFSDSKPHRATGPRKNK